jgi:hypothetical protein
MPKGDLNVPLARQNSGTKLLNSISKKPTRKYRYFLAALFALLVLSMPSFADTYSVTFTPGIGSSGASIAAASTFSAGPLDINWGTDVFTLSATDISEILSDCAPPSAAPKVCATYSASDAGVFVPKLNVGPLLGIDDNGGLQSSLSLLASSADGSCVFEGCSSFGTLSITDLSLGSPANMPEPGSLGMLLSGLLCIGIFSAMGGSDRGKSSGTQA